MSFILTPIDLNQDQTNLINVSSRWAKVLNKTNHLTYVNTLAGKINMGYLAVTLEAPVLEETRDDILNADKKRLEALIPEDSKSNTKGFALAGNPSEVIENLISSKEYSHVFVGHDYEKHGHSFFTGSVADQIVRRSTKPVFVIRDDNAGYPSNIVALIDFDHDVKKIQSEVLKVAKAFESKVTFVNITPNYLKSTPATLVANTGIHAMLRETEIEESKKVKNNLEHLKSDFEKQGIKSEIKILKEKDSISKTIADYLNAESFDMVIMGAHSPNIVERLFLGSVSYDLIHKTTQNIMLIK